MGKPEERHRFIEQVKKAGRIAKKLSELGIRPYGVIRVDSATDPETWAEDPEGSEKIAATFRECCDIAEGHGERLAAEGEICWGGMHSWKRMLELLELVDQASDSRVPGRYGAHLALHVGVQRSAKTRFYLRI